MRETRDVFSLSKQARSLWAKTDRDDSDLWLPLFAHLCDSCLVMGLLWREWLPSGVRKSIARFVGGDEPRARRAACFLAAAHDVGKATPIFQAKESWLWSQGVPQSLSWKPEKAGLPIRAGLSRARKPFHPVAGQVIAERYFEAKYGLAKSSVRNLTSIIGAHHGRPPEMRDRMSAACAKDVELGWDDRAAGLWSAVQFELLDFACALSGFDESDVRAFAEFKVPAFAESLLCGLLVMADWIASNQRLFPLVDILEAGESAFLRGGALSLPAMEQRALSAWDALGVLPAWTAPGMQERFGSDGSAEEFARRFGLPPGARPRPLQRAAIDLAGLIDDPGIMVIEAPMGEGKTEAALAAAEILCARTGRGGVCVALPTMATTDAMFGRVHEWLSHLPCEDGQERKTVYLAHGKAQLNEEFQSMVDVGRSSWRYGSMAQDVAACLPKEDESVIVSSWMFGRKKGMLANFVVCTVDQVLMGALAMKHLSLRQLALANKVVIVDECHAYDAYMQQYLASILSWLGAWRTPVILLSATLPSSIRDALVSSYVDGRRAGDVACTKPVSLESGKRHRRRMARCFQPAQFSQPAIAEKISSEDGKFACATVLPISGSRLLTASYPLVTYSDGSKVKTMEVATSGRESSVALSLIGDEDTALKTLLADCLSGGGCAGVICGTVARAQHAASILADEFGQDAVVLVHARYMDIDRMEKEAALRSMLGPKATVRDGGRPARLIVVGTQVLEQSLDIDFDVMVTDVAPVDLVMQRLGRLHRHARGDGQCDRPEKLRTARCFVRGVEAFEEGAPCFAGGVEKVYDRASLLEAIAVLGLFGEKNEHVVSFPDDISKMVQKAYSGAVGMPDAWRDFYERAVASRSRSVEAKKRRAAPCLVNQASLIAAAGKTMEDLFNVTVSDDLTKNGHGEERGQLAVRDTQETIEVLLAWRDRTAKEAAEGEEAPEGDADGEGAFATDEPLRLLPWVGNPDAGILRGERIPVCREPSEEEAKLFSQCAVRLPASLCRPDLIDGLIEELEESCGQYAAAWTGSPWLSGKLVLILEKDDRGEFRAFVCGKKVGYSRSYGLEVETI